MTINHYHFLAKSAQNDYKWTSRREFGQVTQHLHKLTVIAHKQHNSTFCRVVAHKLSVIKLY